MPKDTLVKMVKEQTKLSHRELHLGFYTSYELLLEQYARAEVFLAEKNLSEEFFEWNARFGVEVELEKKAIAELDNQIKEEQDAN
ncbi:MAG: hypothetical protein H7A25_22315 [Leptospiraceae bacterium]|nr:hypothetical protein [Leptospiraceae bacterium]MCP5502649.1 hypothetical protein [Leptospiraceae bacterium]